MNPEDLSDGTVLATGSTSARALKDWLADIANVNAFGAKGDGATDDTAAIQAAIDYAESLTRGCIIFFPAGVYILSATLTINNDYVKLVGEGRLATIFKRTGNYGSTLEIGSAADPNIDDIAIEGIWFLHDYGGYENGLSHTTLVNKPTSGAHIKVWGLRKSHIRDCEFWNMPRQIWMYGGAVCDISFNTFRGSWDHLHVETQVTPENIRLEQHPLGGLPTDLRFYKNSHTGYLSPSRSVTHGTWTGNQVENIGPLAAIRILAAEVIQVEGGNIGGCNDAAIYIQPQNSIPCLNIWLKGIFFDGNRLAGVRVVNNGGTQTLFNLNISDNIFIGQDNSENAIWFSHASDSVPSVTGYTIVNNTITNYVRTAIVLNNAKGGTLADNTVRDYNCLGGFASNLSESCGLYLNAKVDQLEVTGNRFGGGNAFEMVGTYNTCQYGISVASGATNFHLIGNNVDYNAVIGIYDASAEAGTSGKTIINNKGFNGNRAASSPTLPASGVDWKNPFGSPAEVRIFLGTVSDIKLNGQPMYAVTDQKIHVGAHDVLNITYSSAPSTIWWPQ